MTKHYKIKTCNVCKIPLTAENSYYPKQPGLFCKKHYMEYLSKRYPHRYGKYPTTEKGKIRVKKAHRKSYAKFKDRWITRGKTRYAIKMGKLVKEPCEVCGELKVHAHHDDYTKPLQVRWLCQKHHTELHEKLKKII